MFLRFDRESERVANLQLVDSSPTLDCKRRGSDRRADEVLGSVVGIAGATFAAAELRRIFHGSTRRGGFNQMAYVA